MGEQLLHAQLLRAPVSGSLQRNHAQLLASIEAQELADLLHLVHRVPWPDCKTVAGLVRHVGALDLEFVVPDVAIVVCALRREQLVSQESQLCCTRRHDFLVCDRWLRGITWGDIDLVARLGNSSDLGHQGSAQDSPQLWQPGLPASEVAVSIAVITDSTWQQPGGAQLTEANIEGSCGVAKLGIGGVSKAEDSELDVTQVGHGHVLGLQGHPSSFGVLRELAQATSGNDQDDSLLAGKFLDIEVVQGADRCFHSTGADIL
mmetsp:Transcript_95195/g.199087  ORF Transcript_95195/g.199087 Transcript_95195/m.199087 type:complete len:261 (-) Transcript_95195:4036-4818(-)